MASARLADGGTFGGGGELPGEVPDARQLLEPAQPIDHSTHRLGLEHGLRALPELRLEVAPGRRPVGMTTGDGLDGANALSADRFDLDARRRAEARLPGGRELRVLPH